MESAIMEKSQTLRGSFPNASNCSPATSLFDYPQWWPNFVSHLSASNTHQISYYLLLIYQHYPEHFRTSPIRRSIVPVIAVNIHVDRSKMIHFNRDNAAYGKKMSKSGQCTNFQVVRINVDRVLTKDRISRFWWPSSNWEWMQPYDLILFGGFPIYHETFVLFDPEYE